MNRVFAAKLTILRQRKLFLYLFLVALGVVRNAIAIATLHLRHGVFNVSHKYSSKKPFHSTGKARSCQLYPPIYPL